MSKNMVSEGGRWRHKRKKVVQLGPQGHGRQDLCRRPGRIATY